MNIHPHRISRRRRGFTLIEILMVIGIIAVISALVLAGSAHAITKSHISRAQTELTAIENAIENYKIKVGYYPPDNPNDPTHPPLYYELTGTTIALSGGAPASYTDTVNGDTLTPAQLATIYPGSGISGFANASADPTQVQSFLPASSISGITMKVSTGGVVNTFLGVQLDGPLVVNTVDLKRMSPWSYVAKTSTHSPTNNPDTYDLWVDIKVSGGKTNRISNWSKDPIPL